MREKRVMRYWCDYCNKGGCQKAAMLRHEEHCTLNPQRKCRVCNEAHNFGGSGLAKLVLIAKNDSESLAELGYDLPPLTTNKELVDELKDAADGCPVCVFSALRQAGKIGIDKVTKEDFDLNKELADFWREKNREDEYNDMMANLY